MQAIVVQPPLINAGSFVEWAVGKDPGYHSRRLCDRQAPYPFDNRTFV